MRNALIITAAAALVLAGCSTARESVKDRSREKTSFQSNAPWKPVTDNRADIAMVYGTTDAPGMTFEQRVESWRSHGYNTHFMTGIAWGEYQDYFTGKWDGKPHLDEGQVTAAGDTLWHGYMVPYIVPTDNFIKYMKERQIKRVIDAGIDAIYLEEPEFWAHAGYSDAFKREWKTFYGFDWRPQHESAENTYLSNKLKQGSERGLHLRQGIRQEQRDGCALLCPDALPRELLRMVDREPGGEPGVPALRGRVHIAGMDRDFEDTELL